MITIKKLRLGIGIIMILILSLSGCSNKAEVLRLGSMPTYSAAIYAVGVEKGFFSDAGVNVELTVFKSALDRDAAASAGELDGFMTDIMGAVNLNTKGFPYIMTSSEYEDFAILAGSTIDVAALEVPKTGIAENTVTDFLVDYLIEQPVEKVNIVAVPDRMGALLAGNLELGAFPQPFIGIVMSKGGQLVASSAKENLQPVVLVFDAEYIEKQEKSVKAFYEGYSKTIEYMKVTEYSEYKEALVTYGLATQDTVDLFRLPVDKFALSKVDEKTYDAIVQWMKEKQLIDQPIKFESIQTKKFVE